MKVQSIGFAKTSPAGNKNNPELEKAKKEIDLAAKKLEVQNKRKLNKTELMTLISTHMNMGYGTQYAQTDYTKAILDARDEIAKQKNQGVK